jgi:hypothetical protein
MLAVLLGLACYTSQECFANTNQAVNQIHLQSYSTKRNSRFETSSAKNVHPAESIGTTLWAEKLHYSNAVLVK